MDYFKRWIKQCLLIALLLPTLAFAAEMKMPPVKPGEKTELLFVLLSKQSTIQALKEQPGYYTLTLKGVDPSVIYFTNRPQRYSGKMELKHFVKRWDIGDFKNSPPNAVVEAIRLVEHLSVTDQHSVSYTVVLGHPQYNPEKNILTFRIRSLPGSGGDKLPDMARSDYVALFIDDANVCPGCMG